MKLIICSALAVVLGSVSIHSSNKNQIDWLGVIGVGSGLVGGMVALSDIVKRKTQEEYDEILQNMDNDLN
jgi:hypothetical protein